MIKAGIVTIHRIRNYGALCQAFALNKYLRLNGIDAETIDFRTYRVAESYKNFYHVNSLMDLARNLYVLVHYSKLNKKNKRFIEFLQSNVPMTPKAYYSNDELSGNALKYDYYICGSDQIWNTYCNNYSDAFILKFADFDGVKNRISYAASLGAKDINESLNEKFCDELRKFKAISVREEASVDVIEKISKSEVELVVDPVFLLGTEEWNKISTARIIKKPYIFFYHVKGNIDSLNKFVKNLSAETKLPIVIVNCSIRDALYNNIKCYDAGPAEFVSLIKNAEYVVTNSFHATAFSVIFHKKFFVYNASENGFDRINDLLEICNIKQRQINQNSDLVDTLDEIDYNEVEKRIVPYIEKSKEFLSSAMGYEMKY